MIFLAQSGGKYTFAVPKKTFVGVLAAETQHVRAKKSK